MNRLNSDPQAKYVKLKPGYEISRVIKGGWQLAGGHGQIDRDQAIADMFKYAEAGITTFDCADIYTGVEEMIGEFREQYLAKYGAEKLAEIKVHTKFVPDITILPTITKKYVEEIIERSLTRLKVERLDLVQYHWWDYSVPRYLETASYLQELQKAGKIDCLSVTNFDVPRLQEFVDQGMKIVSTQNQYSVLDQRPEHGLVEFCQKHDIKLLCYGTVAGGFLSEKYLGQREPSAPLENRSLTKYKLIIDDFGGWELFQQMLKTLKGIGDKYGISLTSVAERYVLDKPQVAGIIVGARNASHLGDNLKVFEFSLSEEDKAAIEQITSMLPGPTGDTYTLERIKGGKHASIMKYNLNKEDQGV